MSQKSYTRSFAGGELSQLLFGRLDLTKFQTGLAKCLNFEVTPQGPVQNRGGFEYVLKVKTLGAVLIPFSFNSEQTFALEFGVNYVRLHTQGGTVLEAAKAVTAVTLAAPGVFTVAAHGYVVGDWVFLGTVGGMPALTSRYGIVASVPTANTFTLTDLFGVAIDTSAMDAYTGGGTASRVYEVATTFAADDLFDLHYVQSADVMTLCHQDYDQRELRRLGATNWTLTTPTFVPGIATPAAPTGTAGGPGGGTPEDHLYVITAVAQDTLEESLASPVTTVNQDLTVAGNYIDISPAADVATAVRFNVYKLKGVYGFIGQTTFGTALRDNNIEPDTSKTPPLSSNPFTTNKPRAVSYYEQRRAFGGSGINPQSMWLTRSGTESNMTYSIPSQDDDAIGARIVAREANTIRHLVPLGDLLALTSGGVWRIASSNSDVLTPGNFSVRPQSYVGASNVQPMVTSQSVLYAPDRGAHIREVAYKWETQAYQADDVSVLAPHLFDYQSITQLAYSKAPIQTLWATTGAGLLLGMTHVPEHEVKAWHQHDTQGLFKSVCSVAEGDEDGVYAIIEREINGQTVQYVERKHTRRTDAALEDSFFVDAGATYDGAATTVITGLWHLEGAEVAILADGGVEPVQTVVNGTITLASAASVVQVGLGYNADFQSMPLSMEAAALGQGVVKNINEVFLRVYRSSGIQSGPSFDKLREWPQRTVDDDPGTPPALVTTMVNMKLSPDWQQNGQVCVRQADPLPLTIVSMTLDTATGG